MRRVTLFVMLSIAGCPTTNAQSSDAGTDAPPTDGRACIQGETCDCRAALVVPAGTHWMGSDTDRGSRYLFPAHQVALTRPVWLAAYEATAGCYAACAREGVCTDTDPTPTSIWPGLPVGYWRDPGFADLPVAGLDPAQADAYCAWLGGRLPTNAEFEKAIRGEDGRSAPWMPTPADPRDAPRALELCDHAAGLCGGPLPDAVNTLPMSRGPYGHHHVIGNVEEWVADGYADYIEGLVTDPFTSPTSPDSRVLRSQLGQGWYRNTYEFAGSNLAGVRCAFDTEPEMLSR